jgi:hypothetical protein
MDEVLEIRNAAVPNDPADIAALMDMILGVVKV